MKILISVQDSGGIGGSELFLYQLAKVFKRQKIKVVFSAVNASAIYKLLKRSKEEIYPTPLRMDIIGGWKGLVKFAFFLPAAIFWNYNLLKQFKAKGGDVAIISGISDKLILTPLAKILGFPVIWIEYAPLESVFSRNFYIPKLLYRLVKNLPDLVIVPTLNTKKHIIPETTIPEAKIKIIPLGIEVFSERKLRQIRTGREKLRKELGVEENFVVGMVSRIEKEKGQDTLIKAASLLRKRISDFCLLIIGEGESKYLEKLSEQLGISKLVKFLGYQESEKWRIISCFDVFVFPTRWKLEGFGLVSLEAMMMEIPLVASNFGPVPEVVGDAALLVEPKPGTVAAAIEKLFKDQKLARRLVMKGRKRVKKFNIETVARKYIKEIEDLKRIYG